jgi:hypothetical protein
MLPEPAAVETRTGTYVFETPHAHLLEDLGPGTDADLAEVGLAEQQHHRARLPDSAVS